MGDGGSAAEPGPEAPAGLDRRAWLIAGVVAVGAVMSILDTTIVNVALETISHDLGRPLSEVQWVATGYLLALSVVIPASGWATERFGARRVWSVSIGMFAFGSALCGLAPSLELLIVARVLQGLGGGMIMPVGMSMLTRASGPTRVGRVMSVVGVPMLLAPVFGPMLGGLIIDTTSWQWIFYVNLPVAVLALVLAARVLPRGEPTVAAGSLDVRGLLLISPGMGLMVFGLSQMATGTGTVGSSSVLLLLAGLVLVGLFVRHAARVERPLIDVRLFRRAGLAAAAVTTFAVGAALFGALIVLPLYFQIAKGDSALTTGLLLAPQGLGAALVMPLSGRLTDRIGGGRVAVVGLLVLIAGTIPLALLTPATSLGLVEASLVVRGVGLGATMMPVMAAAYATLSSDEIPRATSALNSLQRLGGAVGTSLLSVVLDSRIAAATGATTSAAGATPSAAAPVTPPSPTVLAAAFSDAFQWAIVLAVVGLGPAVLLARSRRRQSAPTEEAGLHALG